MPMPTDRGYAVIANNEDGTVTVKIATAIEKGVARGVYAQYVRASGVRVDPAIHLARTASYRHTTSVVEVSNDGTTVVLRAPKQSLAT